MTTLPDAEAAAEWVRKAASSTNFPVDLARIIASISGLEVIEDDLDGDGLFLDLGINGAQILLKRSANSDRKRFTLAHEIGHFVIREHAPSRGRNYDVERWCNAFAASLLMPRHELLRYIRGSKLRGLIGAIEIGPRIFGVSPEAFRSQVVNLFPLSIYVFFTNNDKRHRDHFFLSLDKETHWKDDYNGMLSRLLHSSDQVRIMRRADIVIVSGRLSGSSREYLFVILRDQRISLHGE